MGLISWGSNYFNRGEEDYKNEIKKLTDQVNKIKKELEEEHVNQREDKLRYLKSRLSYLDQISKLQHKITDLRVKLILAQQRSHIDVKDPNREI